MTTRPSRAKPDELEPTETGFWQRYNGNVTAPDVDVEIPTPQEATQYHPELRLMTRAYGFRDDVECHWGVPRNGDRSELVLVYGVWSTFLKDLEFIAIPLRDVSAFTRKVREKLKSRTRRKKPRVVFRRSER